MIIILTCIAKYDDYNENVTTYLVLIFLIIIVNNFNIMFNSLYDPLMRVYDVCARVFDSSSKLWNAHTHSHSFDRNPAGTSRFLLLFFFLFPEPSSVPSILKYAKLNSYPPPPPPHPPADPSLPRNTAFRVQWIYTKFIQTTVWCVVCVVLQLYYYYY